MKWFLKTRSTTFQNGSSIASPQTTRLQRVLMQVKERRRCRLLIVGQDEGFRSQLKIPGNLQLRDSQTCELIISSDRFNAACAAARRATGTLNGEQLT